MKKLLIFLLILSLFGCNNINKNKQKSNNFNCPRIFFSSEDRVFIDTVDNSNSFDDLSIKAELNNFDIIEKCRQKNDIAIISFDILIIVKPLNKLDNSEVSIPLYAILLDENNEILETQHFMVSGSINKNFENEAFIETDLINTISVITKNLETNQIVVGFMLDNQKRLLLN